MSLGSPESNVERRKRAGRLVCPTLAARSPVAFTLIEMLVVLAIMGILAALLAPALKNFRRADAMTAAGQQLLGGVARARQLAMSRRTTVYMVFVPTNFWANMSPIQRTMLATTNLCADQLAGYTFITHGAVGDQPGQHQWHYLAPWQTLPNGTFIPLWKFYQTTPPFQFHDPLAPSKLFSIYPFAITNGIPFPAETNRPNPFLFLPYIAFNYLGQLTVNGVDMAGAHAYIPLARGGVLPANYPNTRAYRLGSPQVSEIPPGNSTNTYNIIDIDPLTGRARLEVPTIQ